MNKLLFLISFLFLFQGCLNIEGHVMEMQEEKGITAVYEATDSVWNEALCVWWSTAPKDDPLNKIVKITYPFWIIDFPFEVVFDTLTFPYDWYIVNKREEEKQEKQ